MLGWSKITLKMQGGPMTLKEAKEFENSKYFELSLKTNKISHRDLKRKLAREIVSIYYNNKSASQAEENFDRVIVNKGIPKDIKISVEKQTILKITGVDKDLVSKVAADIKSLKPIEPYKAKGIKERGQFILRKEGKKK